MNKLLLTLPALLALTLTSCQNSRGLSAGPGELENSGQVEYDPSNIPPGAVPSELEPALPEIGKENYQNSVPGDPAIPTSQQPQVTAIVGKLKNSGLSAEQRAKLVQQLSALAAESLKSCLSSIGNYQPYPGEPLLGAWAGSSCNVGFILTGTPNGAGMSLLATSVTSGEVCTGAAAPDGTVSSLACSMGSKGTLTDRPSAGTGVASTKNGCSTGVALVTPTNKIPEKYQSAMKKAGDCYRMALVLQSSILMDPATVALVPYFLGIR